LSVSRSFLILGDNDVSLTVSDLLSINYIPEPEDVTLQTIAYFYEQYLMNRQFRFMVKHRAGEIRVRFEEGTLPHLMAIHKFIPGQAGRSKIAHKGMINGTITLESLEKANSGLYEKFKYRILSAPLIHQIVNQPKFIELDPRTDEAQAHWMVYNKQYSAVFVQLKLRPVDPKLPNFYAPVTISLQGKLPAKKRIDVKEVQELPFEDGWK
jgi:hypothetical protein